MDYFGYTIIILGVLAVVAGFIILYSFHSDEKRFIASLERQAIKRNGTIKKGPFYITGVSTHLNFKYRDFLVDVYWEGKYVGGEGAVKVDTIVDVFYNFKTPFNLKIFQKTIQNKFLYSSLFENSDTVYRDINIGNQEFDDEFVVKGNNEKVAVDFVTIAIQNKLLKYKHIAPGIIFKPSIIFKRDKFTIKIPGTIKEDDEYDELIDIAIMFCDRLKELEI